MITECLTCHKEVNIQPIDYGNGKVAVCPSCGKLAYSEPPKPYREITEQDFNDVGGK